MVRHLLAGQVQVAPDDLLPPWVIPFKGLHPGEKVVQCLIVGCLVFDVSVRAEVDAYDEVWRVERGTGGDNRYYISTSLEMGDVNCILGYNATVDFIHLVYGWLRV